MSNVICHKSNVQNQMSDVKYQMPNVNKVKLLSERTFGAPPVIFIVFVVSEEKPRCIMFLLLALVVQAVQINGESPFVFLIHKMI